MSPDHYRQAVNDLRTSIEAELESLYTGYDPPDFDSAHHRLENSLGLSTREQLIGIIFVLSDQVANGLPIARQEREQALNGLERDLIDYQD